MVRKKQLIDKTAEITFANGQTDIYPYAKVDIELYGKHFSEEVVVGRSSPNGGKVLLSARPVSSSFERLALASRVPTETPQNEVNAAVTRSMSKSQPHCQHNDSDSDSLLLTETDTDITDT